VVDDRGFVFYTNYDSRKAREMEATGRASLLFFWRSLERQVRIDGAVERVSPAESDAYFATRPLDSRLSVYASRQSETIESRDILEDAFERVKRTFGEGPVPRPDWWGGYRIVPDEFEFWQGTHQPASRSPAVRAIGRRPMAEGAAGALTVDRKDCRQP
jgi:pyridoxamine 5'-phosphate oxidase